LRRLLVGERARAIPLANRGSGSLALSDRLENDLAVVLDVVPEDEVGGRAAIAFTLAQEAAFLAWQRIQFGGGARCAAPLPKGVRLRIVH